MKKIRFIIILAILTVISTLSVSANTDEIRIYLNRNRMIFDSSQPLMIHTLYIPLCSLAESLNANVNWDTESTSAVLFLRDIEIEFFSNKNHILFVSHLHKDKVEIFNTPIIRDNTFYLPLDAIRTFLDVDRFHSETHLFDSFPETIYFNNFVFHRQVAQTEQYLTALDLRFKKLVGFTRNGLPIYYRNNRYFVLRGDTLRSYSMRWTPEVPIERRSFFLTDFILWLRRLF